MAELWGDDDHIYGDYLRWQRRFPWGQLISGVLICLAIAVLVLSPLWLEMMDMIP